MSVLLIRPRTPFTSQSGIVSIQYPINIGYLVSYLRSKNINCFVKDYEAEVFNEEELRSLINKIRPVLVGFSCMTPHLAHAVIIAKIIKNHFPGIKTVVGGVHPSAIPEQTLREFSCFDIAVIGEGEETLLELYQKVSLSKEINDINGIAFRQGSHIKVNPRRHLINNIDELPFPDRTFIGMELYKKSHVSRGFSRKVIKIAEVITSRGCPYNCIFCASKAVHSNTIRFRTPQNIILEIENLINTHNIEHVSFLDDIFTLKMDILEPVCKNLKKNNLTFDCFTRVDNIDGNKISMMAESGCEKISFGVESGSQKVLGLLKKNITIKQVKEAFRLCRQARLPKIEATFMIGGHPDETLEDIKLTEQLISELKPDILGLFLAIPYPGTELNSILKERKLLLKENWDEFKLFFCNPSWRISNVPNKTLLKILRKITYSYYLNPTFLFRNLCKIKNGKELGYWISLTWSFMKSRLFFESKKVLTGDK